MSSAHVDWGQRRPRRPSLYSRKKTEDREEDGRSRPLGSL